MQTLSKLQSFHRDHHTINLQIHIRDRTAERSYHVHTQKKPADPCPMSHRELIMRGKFVLTKAVQVSDVSPRAQICEKSSFNKSCTGA